MTTFCERLNYLLKTTNTKQQQLSLGANIDKTSISKYCNDKAIPDSKNLLKIAEFFNVSPLWLSGEDVNIDVSETQTPITTIDISELSPSAVALINKFVTLTKSEQDTFVALASKIFSNNIENN